MSEGCGDVARQFFRFAVPAPDQVEVIFKRHFFLAVGGGFRRVGDEGAVFFVFGKKVIQPLGEILDSFQVIAFNCDNGASRLDSGTCWTGLFQRSTYTTKQLDPGLIGDAEYHCFDASALIMVLRHNNVDFRNG